MTINAALFQHHDSLVAEATALHDVDVSLHDARQALASLRTGLADVQQTLARTHESIDHHEKKITSCQRGWRSNVVLQPDTWLSGGVPKRIERQQEKLKAHECERAKLSEKQAALHKRVCGTEDTVQSLAAAQARKHECERNAAAMHSHVIDALATPALAALRAQRASWQQAVEFERTNAAALEQVAQKCARARREYTMAAQALASAGRTNQNAQLTNTFDLFTPGEGFGLEMFETISQVQRDQLMHTARRHAEVGGRCIHEAMHGLPPAAYQRYPRQCEGLGEVHLPQIELTGGGELMLEVFGGDFGDMIANSSAAGKIGRSLRALDECISIVAQQQALVQALLQALHADGAQAQSGLRQVEGQVARESERIWLEARTRAMGGGAGLQGGMGVACGVAPPVAVAVPVTESPIVVHGLPVATTVQ